VTRCVFVAKGFVKFRCICSHAMYGSMITVCNIVLLPHCSVMVNRQLWTSGALLQKFLITVIIVIVVHVLLTSSKNIHVLSESRIVSFIWWPTTEPHLIFFSV